MQLREAIQELRATAAYEGTNPNDAEAICTVLEELRDLTKQRREYARALKAMAHNDSRIIGGLKAELRRMWAGLSGHCQHCYSHGCAYTNEGHACHRAICPVINRRKK